MYSRQNCCRRNFPMPIACCCFSSSPNFVLNPTTSSQTTQFGFFASTGDTAVETGGTIPLALIRSNGTTISPSSTTAGGVNLLAGRYLVSYTVGATTPAGGTVSTALNLNGVQVPNTVATESQTADTLVNLGQTAILDIPQTSTLTLVNTSAETVTFGSANLTITRL
ncbi:MAG: hypothetical protein IJX00_04790 [Clostridia bacterium]|nr:hypothetical protein [Clostridia bacterium]